jgi:hypothetical protein
MALRSIMLLGNTQDKMSDIGEPFRADGWYGHGEHLYTVAIHVARFQGTVFIEGSLVAEPTDADWFNVVEPIEFGSGDEPAGYRSAETLAQGITFKANVAWIRARMDRPDFSDIYPEDGNLAATLWGIVDRILINA